MDNHHPQRTRWMRNAVYFLWGFSGVTAFAIFVEAMDRLLF